MADAYACATFFFHSSPEDLIPPYESLEDDPSGYLVRMGSAWALVDCAVSENEDWSRQVHLALALCGEESLALTVVLFGEVWALVFTLYGQPGPMVVCVPESERVMGQVPLQLMEFEKTLAEQFPREIDRGRVDAILGAILEGATPIDEGLGEILDMLGVPGDWLPWCRYDAIPRLMLTEPEGEDRALPLGGARQFWEA